jgi:hypothetical protein
MKILAVTHFHSPLGPGCRSARFSNRRSKFKRLFETPVSRKRGIFVTFQCPAQHQAGEAMGGSAEAGDKAEKVSSGLDRFPSQRANDLRIRV